MWCARGSSPLARGTQHCVSRPLVRSGLIPARAGNTSLKDKKTLNGRAHPRSRGEHARGENEQRDLWGSSPLARGTLLPGFRALTPVGLIPARAGNTSYHFRRFEGCRAHPRSRGEHAWLPRVSRALWGSSPLARGTHTAISGARRGVGLIPARAGNTIKDIRKNINNGAHPRSRGEHAR